MIEVNRLSPEFSERSFIRIWDVGEKRVTEMGLIREITSSRTLTWDQSVKDGVKNLSTSKGVN